MKPISDKIFMPIISIIEVVPYGGKLQRRKNLAKLTTNQKFAKFSPSNFYTSITKSHMSIVKS